MLKANGLHVSESCRRDLQQETPQGGGVEESEREREGKGEWEIEGCQKERQRVCVCVCV